MTCNNLAKLLLWLAALTPLGGCVPLILGGTVMGALVSTDRRTSGAQLEDQRIELHAARLMRAHWGERVHINITSYNRQVLLTGEVPGAQDKQMAEKIMSQVENVRAVVNELGVLGHSTLAQRSTDTLITGRVKARLLEAKGVLANAFKVVTERGVTYLMGRVTQREADRATDIARSTEGVQKVVRVFEIISEEELKTLLPPPAPPPANTR
jgi:osmotically-inducible protein OsmY